VYELADATIGATTVPTTTPTQRIIAKIILFIAKALLSKSSNNHTVAIHFGMSLSL